jgi:hypothetical protein
MKQGYTAASCHSFYCGIYKYHIYRSMRVVSHWKKTYHFKRIFITAKYRKYRTTTKAARPIWCTSACQQYCFCLPTRKKRRKTIYSVKPEDILPFSFNRESFSELIVKSIQILLHNKSIICWAIWFDCMLLHLVRTIRYDLIMHRNKTSMFDPLINILFFLAHVRINRQCAIGAHSWILLIIRNY